MTNINLKQFAQLNNLSEDEFKKEIYTTCMAIMSMEMEKNNSAEMIINNGNYILSCKITKRDKK